MSHPVINSFPSGDVIDSGEQNFISQHDRLLFPARLQASAGWRGAFKPSILLNSMMPSVSITGDEHALCQY
ncbi:hypothetical protein DVP64_09485 [Yersinia enterocolitica]|nr:hypothetical protein [Yersinia enterocolitica]